MKYICKTDNTIYEYNEIVQELNELLANSDEFNEYQTNNGIDYNQYINDYFNEIEE